jgi:hypothetical protein
VVPWAKQMTKVEPALEEDLLRKGACDDRGTDDSGAGQGGRRRGGTAVVSLSLVRLRGAAVSLQHRPERLAARNEPP